MDWEFLALSEQLLCPSFRAEHQTWRERFSEETRTFGAFDRDKSSNPLHFHRSYPGLFQLPGNSLSDGFWHIQVWIVDDTRGAKEELLGFVVPVQPNRGQIFYRRPFRPSEAENTFNSRVERRAVEEKSQRYKIRGAMLFSFGEIPGTLEKAVN